MISLSRASPTTLYILYQGLQDKIFPRLNYSSLFIKTCYSSSTAATTLPPPYSNALHLHFIKSRTQPTRYPRSKVLACYAVWAPVERPLFVRIFKPLPPAPEPQPELYIGSYYYLYSHLHCSLHRETGAIVLLYCALQKYQPLCEGRRRRSTPPMLFAATTAEASTA